MNRRITGLLAAGVLALVGTLVLVGYVRAAEARALSGEELVDVLVVTDEIEKGTPSEKLGDAITVEQVPVKVRADRAIDDLDDVKGKVAAIDLVPGEQLVASRFTDPASLTRVGVPAGLLEVTVALAPERAVGGRIAPGDTVAVIASFDDMGDGQPASHLVLHKVVISAVQTTTKTETSSDDDNEDEGAAARIVPAGELLVTLALDGPAVERVVFAAEHGSLWLSAEPKEASETGTKVLTKASVFA